ncbi:MAG TPA: cytochrome c oxidase subunit 4 [Ktedonobacteraceae bacterium]|nr:cytochrome c oxidase subunit 4 [Ktedonobacteraceae bacterium]
MADESGSSEKKSEQPVSKTAQVPLEIREQRLAPRPSVWPIALAFTLALALMGIIIHPIILASGIVLTIAAIIGWILEKQ